MADGLVCQSSLNMMIRSLLRDAIKSVFWDNVTRRVLRIFNYVNVFIIHTFLLLYFHLDTAFIC